LTGTSNKNKQYYNFTSDFSGFDNTVRDRLIKHAISILRCCFPKSVFVDNLFIYFYSSLCYKNVVLPNGYIIRIKGGIATGHPGTS